jgi:hypothetical protein
MTPAFPIACVPAQRTQRDRDAGQPEVERAALQAVDLRAQYIRAPRHSLAVPVIAEVLVGLVQRKDHAGQTMVEGRVSGVLNYAIGQPVRRATSQQRGLRTTRQLTRQTHNPRLAAPSPSNRAGWPDRDPAGR